jgi:hypothetical protein
MYAAVPFVQAGNQDSVLSLPLSLALSLALVLVMLLPACLHNLC